VCNIIDFRHDVVVKEHFAMPKAVRSFFVKFTLVGRALPSIGFDTNLPAEGRSTPTHRHFQPSGWPCLTSPLILSACGKGGQHFAFSFIHIN